MCVVHHGRTPVRRDWCTRHHCSVREGAMYGPPRRKFGEIKYYFAALLFFKILVLADAEEANKVIIIAPISESDTVGMIDIEYY